MTEKHVFLSHSSADKTLATEVAERLKSVGVWVDFWDLDAGDLLPNRIAEAIHGSKWFVLIASVHAMDSRWIKYEVNSAIIKWIEDRDYKIIVARIDDCLHQEPLKKNLLVLRSNLSIN